MNFKRTLNTQVGMTLIELLVVIAIMALVTWLVLANYKSFNTDVTLTNAAYDLALTIRQTQLYGSSVKQSTQGQFQTGFGIHFSNSNNSYSIYQDLNSPLTYQYDQTANPTELISTNQLPVGIKIVQVCILTSSQPYCENTGNNNNLFLDIEFVRPNPFANFTTNIPLSSGLTRSFNVGNSWNDLSSRTQVNAVQIILSNGVRSNEYIYINQGGLVQISTTQIANP